MHLQEGWIDKYYEYTLGKSILRNKCVDYTWTEAQSLADKIMLDALHFLQMS